MKKIIERLLIFIIGVPAIFAIVMFLPFRHNLIMNLVVVFFSGVGALEFSSMLEKKNIKIPKAESFILGAIGPLALTLHISFDLPVFYLIAASVALAMWALVSRVFSKACEIENITNKVVGCFSLILYPGFFMSWLVLMSIWERPAIILLFLFITFGNDSFAWLFGTLFGAKNRGIIAVSPNKSIAGYIGGLLGSVIVAAIAMQFLSFIFHKQILIDVPFSIIETKIIILGLCTGIAASLGDLAESAIKRSCDFVDSGNFILGRGGVLDSIDSIAFAAPVFFLLFFKFFQ
ncbi:MAG: phosphatidate cytidylyltransferase [Treponema sp.]|nr:phosphatidate cytidylyltransferase [Treponema sp.]